MSEIRHNDLLSLHALLLNDIFTIKIMLPSFAFLIYDEQVSVDETFNFNCLFYFHAGERTIWERAAINDIYFQF